MRNRNCRVEIYFTQEELERLKQKVDKTNLSHEAFIRALLNDCSISEKI